MLTTHTAHTHTTSTSHGSVHVCSNPVTIHPRCHWMLQLALLRRRWPGLLAGLSFQYVHGIFTQLAYRNHVPLAEGPLPDLGFELLPVCHQL
jgi:hypothetical protein